MPPLVGYENDNQGLGGLPKNSSLDLLDLKRQIDREGTVSDIRNNERELLLSQQSDEQNRISALNEARAIGQQEGSSAPRSLGPSQGQDLNSYISNGLRSGTLQPQEAMLALEDPSVDPQLKSVLSESLGINPRGGLGSVSSRSGLGA